MKEFVLSAPVVLKLKLPFTQEVTGAFAPAASIFLRREAGFRDTSYQNQPYRLALLRRCTSQRQDIETIGTLVIGKNDGWKQEINMGKRNNQQFVQIPFARFIDMLTYKAEMVGIGVILQEESHTSKCSFLDLEPICHHERYVGKRIKRGLFRASNGKRINADVNGSLNIIRKAIPNSFGQGIEGVAVRPVGAPTN
ncbi:hypothetical protein KSD_70250 [Ktedonobacter sp. SOSP1-85]|nr:transposase [Ktedonobacter sp. SOSP1-85]GHO79254.1 hypothetical protein KSD_70250 [Ktedonobacter sp. SOSP1-85]